MSMGSTTPVDALAGMMAAKSGIATIPIPGSPVLEMPIKNAPAMAIHPSKP